MDENGLHPDQVKRTSKRWRERGNVFFTLFGAVAVVGVLGAGIMSTMRGPLSTMVNVNRQTQAESEMTIAARMVMLESASQAQSGDCDADGYVEPLEYGSNISSLSGGGTIPNAVGVSKVDPWGTDYGYCAWDAGAVNTKCSGASSNLLNGNGADDQSYSVIAIISAGPDRTFDTSCSNHPGLVSKSGDDIVRQYDYAGATSASGGLWKIKSGDPDTAEISKSLDVTGGAKFTDSLDLTASTAQLQLGAASLMLPTDDTPGTEDFSCGAGNNLILRINDDLTPPIVEICDGLAGTPAWHGVAVGDPNVSTWTRIDSSNIYFGSSSGVNVGIGTSSPGQALDVVGNIRTSGDLQTTSGNVSIAGGNSVVWGSGAQITDSAGALQINGNGGTGVELTVATDIIGMGTAPVTGNTVTVQGATSDDSENAFVVRNSTPSNILVVANDGNVGIGNSSPNEALDVNGSINAEQYIMLDGNTVLWGEGTIADTIAVGNRDLGSASTITGDLNTVVGGSTAIALTSGTNNTVIGSGAAPTLSTGSENIVIGSDGSTAVDVPSASISNYLNIGNSIFGDLANKRIGIGQADNSAVSGFDDALEVEGNVHASGELKASGDVSAANVTASSTVTANIFKITGDSGNFGPAPTCADNQKLEYDGGWSCVGDAGSGSGAGGGQTLAEVLTEGNDGGAKQIKNILDPTADQDAATKKYVDGAIVSGSQTVVDDDGDTQIQVEESDDEDKIRFDTANAERMIIDDAGNVGIGISNPLTRFQIVTSANTSVDGATIMSPSAGWLRIAPDLEAGDWGSLSQSGDAGLTFSDGTINTGGFVLAPWNNTGAGLRMTSAGNVGIATASPASKLHIAGDLLLSNAASTCTALQKGALRLNTGSDQLEMCDGVGTWNAYAAGGGGAEADLNFDRVSLLMHYDADLSDSSRNNHTLNAGGDAAVSSAQKKFGAGSLLLDGTGDYLNLPGSNASSILGTESFTIETWIYMPSVPTDIANIMGQSNGSGDQDKWGLSVNMSDTYTYQANRIHFFNNIGGGAETHVSANYTWSANTWYHIAVSNNAGAVQVFVNGASVATAGSFSLAPTTGTLRIGTNGENEKMFNGYIDDLRITKGVARYTSKFPPPTQAFSDSSYSLWAHNEDDTIYYNTADVGIGTSTPTSPLDVVSTVFNVAEFETPTTGGSIVLKRASSYQWYFGVEGDSDFYLSNVDNTDANKRLFISASTGNVGIGTVTPGSELDVSGIIRAQQLCDESGTNCADLSTGGSVVWAKSGNDISYTSGDVGIGTTAPTKMLDIDGGSAGTGTLRVGASNQGDGYIFLMEDTANNYGFSLGYDGDANVFELNRHENNSAGTNVITIPRATGNIGIGTTTPGSELDVSGIIRAQQLCDESGTNCADLSTGGSVVWAKSGNDISYTSGNVGIGTTNPYANLHVNESGDERQFTVRAWADVAASADGRSVFGANVYRGASSNDFRYANTHASIGAGGMTVNWPLWGDVTLFASEGATTADATFTPTAGFVLKPSGNVGIGTTDPQSPLQIGNNILFDKGQGNISNGSDILLTANGVIAAENSLYVNIDSTNDTTGSFFSIRKDAETASATELFRVQENGNVGIGTTSPAAPLHVQGGNPNIGTRVGYFSTGSDIDTLLPGTTTGGLIQSGDNAHMVIGIRDNDNADSFSIVSGGGNYMSDTTYDTVVMTATALGNVGIGVASPTESLHVSGNGIITGNLTVSGNVVGGDGNPIGVWTVDDDDIYYSSGNVGIGTATPSEMLDVAGTVQSNGFITDDSIIFQFDNTSDTDAAVDTDWRMIRNDGTGNWHTYINSNGGTSPTYTTDGFAYHEIYDPASGNYSYQVSPSGTAGNAVTWDTTFAILGNGNVGIGTGSPTESLHVSGNGIITGNLTVSGNVVGGDGNPIGVWTVDDDDIYYSSGNVGIGIASPGAKLDVNGSTRLRGNVYTQGDTMILNKAGNNWLTWADRDVSGSEALVNLDNIGTITTTGSVGVGTSSPATALDVTQTGATPLALRRTGSSLNTNILYENATESIYAGLTSQGGFGVGTTGDVSTSALFYVDDSGNVGIGKTDPSVIFDVDGGAYFDVGATDQDFAVIDNDKGSVANAIWYDYSAGKVYLGNTGAAGAAKEVHVRGGLEVDSDSTFDGRALSTGGQSSSSGMATATGNLGGFEARSQGTAGTAGAAFIAFHRPGAYATYLGLDTDNQLKVGGWSMGGNAYKIWHENNDGPGSGLDADTIDGVNSTNLGLWTKSGSNAYYNTGNIAIGGTDATNKLTLTGIGDITGANTGGGLLIEDSTGDATGHKLRIDANEMQASNAGSAVNFVINPFGGVVITGSTLQVGGGDLNLGGAKNALRGSDAYLRLNQDGDFTSGVYTPSVFRADGGFNVDGNTIISADGRTHYFGNGDQYLSGDQSAAVYLNNNHSTVTRLIMRDKEDVNYGSLYGDGNGANFGLLDGDGNWGLIMIKDNYTAFRINDSEKMRIETGGDVGIGTTDPGQKLEVAGNIKVDGSIIAPEGTLRDDGGGWVRTYGNTGWYNGTHGGGWTMQDSTWIRTYGNKGIYHNSGLMRTDGTFQVGTNGGTLSVANGGDLAFKSDVLFGDYSSGRVGIGMTTPSRKLVVQTDSNQTTDGIYVSSPSSGAIGLYPDLATNSYTSVTQAGDSALIFSEGSQNTGNLVIAAWNGNGKGVRITSSGYVGINNTSPNVELDITGSIEYTGRISDVSDRRLKTNIKPLIDRGSMLERIKDINTYTFRMKDDETGLIEYGVMAQEIEEIFPELVTTADDEMGTKTMNYIGLIAPMIEAMKEISTENEDYKERLASIEEDIKGLKAHTGYGLDKAQFGMGLLFVMILTALLSTALLSVYRKRGG